MMSRVFSVVFSTLSHCHSSFVDSYVLNLIDSMSLSSGQDSLSQAKYQTTLRNLMMTCAHTKYKYRMSIYVAVVLVCLQPQRRRKSNK